MKHKNKIQGIVTGVTQINGSHGYPRWVVSVNDGATAIKASSGHCSSCGFSISKNLIGKEVLMKFVPNSVCNRLTYIEEI